MSRIAHPGRLVAVIGGLAGAGVLAAAVVCPDGPPPPFPDDGTYTADLESLFTASDEAATTPTDTALEAESNGRATEDPTTADDPVIVPEATAEGADLAAGPGAEWQEAAVAEPPEAPADVQPSLTAEAPAPGPATQADPTDPASTEDAGVSEPGAPAEAPAPTEIPTEPAVEPAPDPGA